MGTERETQYYQDLDRYRATAASLQVAIFCEACQAHLRGWLIGATKRRATAIRESGNLEFLYSGTGSGAESRRFSTEVVRQIGKKTCCRGSRAIGQAARKGAR